MARVAFWHMRGSADNRELLQSTSIRMRHKVSSRMRSRLIIRPFPAHLVAVRVTESFYLYSWRWLSQPFQRGNRFSRRSQDKALANQGKSLLRQFRLEKLIFRTGKEVGISSGNGSNKVMHGDGLAVEGSLLISVGGQPHWLNGAGVFRQNRPQVAVVLLHRKRQKRFQRAWIEIGQKHRPGMRSQPGTGALSACRDIQ